MPITITEPKLTVERDEKGRLEKCFICVSVENTTNRTVSRSVSFFRKGADDKLEPLVGCPNIEIEIPGMKKVGGNSVTWSVEKCCQIFCPETTETFLAAVGTQLDANNEVDVNNADDKKEAKVRKPK